MKSVPLGPGLPSPTPLLFNCPKRGIMLILNRLLISLYNDDKHYEELVKRQTKNYDKNHDIPRYYDFIPIGSTVALQ